MTIPIKIECSCGQHYAFDIEPVNSRMPVPVSCPACGLDGTEVANQLIAQALAVRPLSLAAGPPPLPPATVRPVTATPLKTYSAPAPRKGKDGWATEETQLNKLGTYLTVGPAILAALIAWGIIGLQVATPTLFIVVGIGGLLGGALNVAGRGPIVAGSLIGLVIAVGGYGVVCWWLQGRQSVYKAEVILAFGLGTIPGFLLQYGLQWLLKRRASSR